MWLFARGYCVGKNRSSDSQDVERSPINFVLLSKLSESAVRQLYLSQIASLVKAVTLKLRRVRCLPKRKNDEFLKSKKNAKVIDEH